MCMRANCRVVQRCCYCQGSSDVARKVDANDCGTRAMIGARLGLVLLVIPLLLGQTRGIEWLLGNCRYSSWTSWTICTHKCGNAGTQSRSRHITNSGGWFGKNCKGDRSNERSCNRRCRNGGTPLYRKCRCSDAYWGDCCENCKYRPIIWFSQTE